MKFQNKDYKICVIGLGYVGLPLSIEFGNRFKTIGYDKSVTRINQLKSNLDMTGEISQKKIKQSKHLNFTVEKKDIKSSNIYIITVPTPVDKFNSPDLNALISATKLVASVITENNFIIYESTVFPGATEELCVPILESISGLKYNNEFYCGYSPERINPSDKEHTLPKIIKITSGSNKFAADFVDNLYKYIIPAGTHKVSSIAVAEAAKVIENTQRDVNIALVNEFSIIFNMLGLDSSEIINAAKTKWNFLPFRPGLVGGHCIGVDPYYLTHKAISMGYSPEIILAGRKINDNMSTYLSNITIEKMLEIGINPIGSNVAILGVTFKKNCADIRNSKSFDIIKNLEKKKCQIVVSDPFADKVVLKDKYKINLIPFDELKKYDVLILAVDHDDYKNVNLQIWLQKLKDRSVFIDVKSAYKKGFFDNTSIIHWRL